MPDLAYDSFRLRRAIDERTAVLGVIGLGYVGLPVACSFAAAGFRVIGVDLRPDLVEKVRQAESPIQGHEPGLTELLEQVVMSGKLEVTTDHRALKEANIVTINVETPVDADHRPNLSSVEAATRSLADVLQPGTLVIVESTVPPGTAMGLVAPLLEEHSNLEHGEDFVVGACPERVMPGKLLNNLRTVARVVGAPTVEVADTMRAFYASVVEADIDLTDPTTAELVKVAENAYRDVQIAFANELALISADLGIDVWKVRQLVNKVPFRDMHRPGGGVGGHCIPKDPWLLAASARRGTSLLPVARAVNDSMPTHVADAVTQAAASRGAVGPVAVLGMTYLADSDDTRNSPSDALVDALRERGHEVITHDPHIPEIAGPLDAILSQAGVVVVMVPHREYLDGAVDHPLVIDARRLHEAREGRSVTIRDEP